MKPNDFQRCCIVSTRIYKGREPKRVAVEALLPCRYYPPDKDVDQNPQCNIPTFEVIGQGSYGHVIAVRSTDAANSKLVLKRMNLLEMANVGDHPVSADNKFKRLNRELHLLHRMKHPNIVKFERFFHSNDPTGVHINIEMEQADTTLRTYYATFKPGDTQQHQFISAMLSQLLLAGDYLQKNNIMHRDIKPDNVGINMNGFCIKLLDFGIARYESDFKEEHTTDIGTQLYQAPEVSSVGYDRKVDLWGIIVTVIEFIHFERPLFLPIGHNDVERRRIEICGMPAHKYRDTYNNQFERLTECPPTPIEEYLPRKKMKGQIPDWECTTDNFYELVGWMLKIDYNERKSVEDCLEHRYVATMKRRFPSE